VRVSTGVRVKRRCGLNARLDACQSAPALLEFPLLRRPRFYLMASVASRELPPLGLRPIAAQLPTEARERPGSSRRATSAPAVFLLHGRAMRLRCAFAVQSTRSRSVIPPE